MSTTTPAAPTAAKDAPPPPDGSAKKGKADKKAKKAKGDGTEAKGGKKKLIIILVVVALVGFVGYSKFIKKPGPPGPPEPGIVLKLDPITMNLAGGHFLKLTMALQFTTKAAAGGHGGAEPDGSRALDLAISQLSNKRIADLNSGPAREHAKEKLLKSIEEAYHHEVMDIYFTEFVMQ